MNELDTHHSGPRRRMVGDTATVSTLVTVVGQPYKPTLAGNGGFNRGLPCTRQQSSLIFPFRTIHGTVWMVAAGYPGTDMVCAANRHRAGLHRAAETCTLAF